MKILKYGSNENRKKLTHIPALDLTATRILEPIIHSKGYKARPAAVSNRQKKGGKRGEQDDEENQKLVLGKLDDQARMKKSMKLDQAERY